MGELDGKVALVTGAAGKRGIGRATALYLAREGADVAVNDLSMFGGGRTENDIIENWRGLEDVVGEITAMGRKGLALEADTSSSQQIEEMVSKCLAAFGKIDILVNNAGILGPINIDAFKIEEKDWQRVININLMGTYRCSKAVGKSMIERGQGGKIINLASMAGKFYYNRGHGPYTVSKFAIVGLTQVLALELAPFKINVNAVCPGFISTELVPSNIRRDLRSGIAPEKASAKMYTDLIPRIPLGRPGSAEEVAGLITFLASSRADYMTGQSINITGGFLMCH